MPSLKCSIIEKLAKEGKISTLADSTSPKKYKEIGYKIKLFNKENYETGFYSRRRVLRN